MLLYQKPVLVKLGEYQAPGFAGIRPLASAPQCLLPRCVQWYCAAVQLKLKRAEKPKTRDKAAGVWYIYHAVGGAITVLNKE